MPGIDGIEALKAIKAAAPELPVVLMSAFATEEQAGEASRHGAHTCLYKPLEAEKLVRIVDEISRRKLRAFLGEPFDRPTSS